MAPSQVTSRLWVRNIYVNLRRIRLFAAEINPHRFIFVDGNFEGEDGTRHHGDISLTFNELLR